MKKRKSDIFFKVEHEFQMPVSLVLCDIEYWLIAHFESIA